MPGSPRGHREKGQICDHIRTGSTRVPRALSKSHLCRTQSSDRTSEILEHRFWRPSQSTLSPSLLYSPQLCSLWKVRSFCPASVRKEGWSRERNPSAKHCSSRFQEDETNSNTYSRLPGKCWATRRNNTPMEKSKTTNKTTHFFYEFFFFPRQNDLRELHVFQCARWETIKTTFKSLSLKQSKMIRCNANWKCKWSGRVQT